MSYTPGPWDRTGLLIVSTQYKEPGSDKINLDIASVGGRTDKEALSNARLIVAAPDTVESLRKLIMHCTNYAGYLKTLGAEFAEMRDRVQGEIDEASAILRRIDGEEKTE